MSNFNNKGIITSTSGFVEAGSDNFGILLYGSVSVEDFGTSQLGFRILDYTPSTGTNRTSSNVCTFNMSKFGNGKYVIICDVEWSGFSTITSSDFSLKFQGSQHTIGGGTTWDFSSTNQIASALNSAMSLTTLVKSSPSGNYHYVATANFTKGSTLDGLRLGIRSDNSNGVGNIKVTNIQICPERFYDMTKASIFKSGEVGAVDFYEF